MSASLPHTVANHDTQLVLQSSHIVELVSRLENAITTPRTQKTICFPGHLTEALLRAATPVDSSILTSVIPILDHNKEELNQILHPDSIRSLAYLILNSNFLSDQECGLHLLLDKFIDEDGPQTSHPLPTKWSSHIRRKLTESLCSRFLDENWGLGLRRQAGRLLLGMFLELENTGSFFYPDQVEYPYHGFVSTFCNQADTVMRFFAGSVLRILHVSGINADMVWTHDSPESRSLFFTGLRTFPEDWPRAFHFYIRELGCITSSNVRRNGSTMRQGITQSVCHSVKSISIDTKSYTDGFKLATTTADTLALIVPVRRAHQQYFDLIEVPLNHILNRGPNFMDRTKEKVFRLQIHIDANGIVRKNGKCQKAQNPMVLLASEEDLTDLWTRIKNFGKTQDQVVKKLVGRRPSSVFIPLDTGDEVAEKTVQYETESDVATGDSLPLPPAQTQNGSVLPIQAAMSKSVVESTVNHGSLDDEPRGSTAAKADRETAESGQNKGRALSVKNKTALPSNTQDSLQLSRLRNIKWKVYTPDDEVDWDEDLRPTDDSPEKDEKDAEFTSVSSPLPSASPALKRRAGTAKKRKSGATSKAGSSKKPAKKSNPKAKKVKAKGKPKNPKLPLLPRSSSADNEIQNAIFAQKTENRQEKEDENAHDPTYNGNGTDVKRNLRESLERQIHPTLPNRSISPYGSEAALINGEGFDPSKGLDLVSEASVFPENLWDSSTAWLTQVDGNWNDDAQDSREENRMDWEVHSRKNSKSKQQTKPHQGTGKTLGKKLAAALLEAGIFSDNPPPKDRSSSHHIPVGESKQYKRSEVSSPSQGGQSPTPTDQRSTPEDRKRFETQQIKLKDPETDAQSGNPAVVTPFEEDPPGERSSMAIEELNACSTKKFTKVSASAINRKRTASQEPMKRQRNKKRQAERKPEHQPPGLNESTRLSQRKLRSVRESDTFDQVYPDKEPSSWATTEYGDITSDAGNVQPELHLHPPRTDLGHSTPSSPRTPIQNRYTKRKPKSLPKAIVDENGSPRLRVRQSPDTQRRDESMGKWHGQLVGQRPSAEQEMGHMVYNSDSDTDYYPSKICTFRSRVHLHFGEDLLGAKGQEGSGDTRSEASTSIASVEQPLSTAEGLGGFPAESVLDDTPIAISTLTSSSEVAMEIGIEQPPSGYELVASQSPSVENPVQLESELAGLNARIDGDDMAMRWQTTLQAIQQTTDDVLANTSKSLMHHVQREQETINRVLELYLEGCQRILERLGKAQEERIAVYRQQMNSIKEHQADLCRDLVRRLEGKK